MIESAIATEPLTSKFNLVSQIAERLGFTWHNNDEALRSLRYFEQGLLKGNDKQRQIEQLL
jgi:hypothetical protein